MAISIGEAVGSGFVLVGRRPLSVLGWGGFFVFLVFLLEMVALMIFGFPAQPMVAAGASPVQIVAQTVGAALPRTIFILVGELIIGAIVQAAVLRAVLEPNNKAFIGIRFGASEGSLLLLLLLYVPIWIGVMAVTFALFVVIGLVARVVGAWSVVVLGLVYGLGLLWLGMQFSMAAPMTFAERRVRFLGSWALTRDDRWGLFGLALLLIVVALGLALGLIIVFGLLAAIFMAAGVGAVGGVGALQGLAYNPTALLRLGPLFFLAIVVFLGVYAFVLGATQAIFVAPIGEAYRQLRGSPDVSEAFT